MEVWFIFTSMAARHPYPQAALDWVFVAGGTSLVFFPLGLREGGCVTTVLFVLCKQNSVPFHQKVPFLDNTGCHKSVSALYSFHSFKPRFWPLGNCFYSDFQAELHPGLFSSEAWIVADCPG